MPARSTKREGLGEALQAQLEGRGEARKLGRQSYLFHVGDAVDALSVVTSGDVELCYPLTERRLVVVERLKRGNLLGWSALVPPYRSTLTCRATSDVELCCYPREVMKGAFEADPRFGYEVMRRLTELIGARLSAMQALWLRELQRAIEA